MVMHQENRSFRLVSEPEAMPLVEEFLAAEGFRFEPEPFSPFCRRLLSEPMPLGSSLAAFFGYIYIQDRSSMLPPLALAPGAGDAVLDMAASPGSKSGFLGQLCGRAGFVLANEPNAGRLATLRANLGRCNLVQVATCSYAGEKIPLEAGWSHILLDPPCSGWGTVNRHPDAIKIWQGDKINKLIGLQRQLLARAASLLAPGGRLLYSTCTTNPQENEEQTRFALENLGLLPEPISPFAGFTFREKPNGALLVDGEESGSQGFYLALLTKPGNPADRPDHEWPLPGLKLESSELASPVMCPKLLPRGAIAAFGDKARFLPEQAGSHVPPAFRWQGSLLGKWSNGLFTPWPRLRICLPGHDLEPSAPRVQLETAAEVRALLTGSRMDAGISASMAALWWRDLPLGICQIKNGRIIAAFR